VPQDHVNPPPHASDTDIQGAHVQDEDANAHNCHAHERLAPHDQTLLDTALAHGAITAAGRNTLLAQWQSDTETLIAALMRLGLVNSQDLAGLISSHFEIPLASDADWPHDPPMPGTLSRSFLRDQNLVPLGNSASGALLVAVSDPTNQQAIQALKLAAGRPVELRVAPPEAIASAIEAQAAAESAQPLPDAAPAQQTRSSDDDIDQLRDLALGAPVVRLVNDIMIEARHAGATDVHFEPLSDRLQIRFRVDGLLRTVREPPSDLSRAVVSRIKILSGLDIAERRLPQDGRAKITIEGHPFDVRVATAPAVNGEAVAIRILDHLQKNLDLEKLGFNPQQRQALLDEIASPHGLIIVTGPTGSGKTTTLAALLKILNEPSRKILAVEDPIEYQIDGINQVQVRPEIGLDFARALRAFLRHDPDIIMVGEMRDGETAQIGVHAALTGHLVLSTLHTNSAPGAIPRLIDMGVDSYLLASSLRAVIAQRLVRLICRNCARQHAEPGAPGGVHWIGEGCRRCKQTGYAGRTTVLELMPVTSDLKRLIQPGVTAGEIARAARASGMTSLHDDGLAKCAVGLTSLEEVRRVTATRD